jgi:16S rRNA (cytosine1402-N4)-methyltransferase
MRMDRRRARSAADVLATLSRDELTAALVELADEEAADRIAAALVRRRRTAPILRTLELAEVVLAAKGYIRRDGRRHKVGQPGTPHPAALTFQALRILVNDELGSLRQLLRDAPRCLRPGGRIGILTFHSGEDRMVKQAFREGLRDGTYDKIAEDVVRPTSREIASNPRSRPTKFRWARRRRGAVA